MGLEIGKTVDGYEIVEVLGSSKTGVAYKVRNVFAQRFEVLKILPKGVQDDEEQKARFLREIKVHAQLLHPNIVTFYNAREMEGQLVMTTEFVPGATLADRLEAGPIAWRDACHYAGQALSALNYAHDHGIVHRGLSSSNLILTPGETVRLTGFGLAKSIADPDLTAAGSVVGALKYMAPEQVKGEAIDGRSDLYSLGIVLYEMLTGKLPFAAKGQFEIMLAHVNTAPMHASDVNAGVPRELGDAVAKALAKSPGDRFASAQELRGAIERISLKSEPTPQAAAPEPEPQPAPAHLESPPPVVEPAAFVETPTPVSSSEPWDAWSFDPPAEPEPPLRIEPTQFVPEAATLSEPSHTQLIEPAIESAESKPVAELSAVPEAPAPVSTNVLWDAHAIEAALLSAQSKLPSAEPEPSAALAPPQSVPEAAALTETPAPASSNLFRDEWWINPHSASAESPAPAALDTVEPLVESAESTETAAPISSTFLWDSWAINTDPAPVEANSASAESHTAEPPVEAAASTETPVPVSSATLWDAWAVESALTSAESKLAVPESQPAASELEMVASPVVLPTALHDPWAFESKAAPAESRPAESELAPPLPVVTALADTPVDAPPSLPYDAWASELPAQPEAKSESFELKLLSTAVETPPQAEPSAEEPVLDWSATLPDSWVHEPVAEPAESRRESSELALLSAAIEPPKLLAEAPPPTLPSTTEEPPAIEFQPPSVLSATPSPAPEPEPVLDWPTTLPDLWVHEPVPQPAESRRESSELALLSAALEPPKLPAEAPPSTTEEPPAIEFQPPSVLSATPSPAPEPAPALAAAAAVAIAPGPVVKAVPPPNPDLLTALFGDTFLSRLSLILVVCAITFFLGTVTLFAVLSVTK
jgi:serine/threonine protein kinase